MNKKLLSVLGLAALVIVFACFIWHRTSRSIVTLTANDSYLHQGGNMMVLPDFSALVEKEGRSVVSIRAGNASHAQNALEGKLSDHPFLEFYRRLFPNVPLPEVMPDYDQISINTGAGFIISRDGYIITNAHVVAGHDNITVTTTDKHEYVAKLIGIDQKSDIALLKVDAIDLPAVRIGHSSKLKVGEWVAAIGAPFGFDNSLTAGIVSAKGRSLPEETYTPFIQTDVAINPGNSGGPLFNLRGEVVGVNSQIYSRSGGFQGISFAIPIDVAMNVVQQLKQTGQVARGRLGIIIQGLSYNLAQSFGLEQAAGALVSQITPDSPAERAGLKVGDIILKVNDTVIRDSGELPVVVGMMLPDTKVELTIWRAGRQEKLAVKLGRLETQVSVPTGKKSRSSDGSTTFESRDLGLTLRPAEKGLVVEETSRENRLAGLRLGDIIVSVGYMPVNDQASFERALLRSGEQIPVLVVRGRSTLFLALGRVEGK